VSEFSRDEMKALLEEQIPPCISIYIPSHVKDGQPWQEPIHLKTMLQDAQQRLLAMDVSRADAEQMLAPARALLEDNSFWREPREGLAMFISASPAAFRYYSDNSIAVEFEPTLVVGNQFHFTPLLPLLTGDGVFYVLALDQNHVGLLKCTRDTFEPVEVPNLPENVNAALGQEIPGRWVQGRPMNVAGGEQTGVFGGFDPSEYDKDKVIRFCHAVANALHTYLSNKHEPLIVAGQGYLHPIYRSANDYAHLLDEGITVDADSLKADELHSMAWKIVEPYFHAELSGAIDRFGQYSNTQQVSNKLSDILAAAHYGRVATLFVAEGEHQYGKFDPNTSHLEVHKESRPDNVDLVDEAATHTVVNGGVVYVVPKETMPDRQTGVAAIYRY